MRDARDFPPPRVWKSMAPSCTAWNCGTPYAWSSTSRSVIVRIVGCDAARAGAA